MRDPLSAPVSVEAAPFTFDVVVTLEDQLALQLACLSTPAMRAGRLRRDGLIVAAAVVASPVIIVGTAAVMDGFDPAGPPLPDLLRDLLFQPATLLAGAAIMLVCSGGGALVQHALRRPWLRRILRRILLARPDVDRADPNLPYRATVTVDADGLESRTAIGAVSLRWPAFRHWEERGPHLLILGDAMIGFCLRTATLDAPTLARLRTTLQIHLGPPGPRPALRPAAPLDAPRAPD